MNKVSKEAPTTSEDFDRAYQLPITFWGDVRIPDELKELAELNNSGKILEFGCGIGRFSRYMAKQGLQATAVDFSPIAISKAKKNSENDTFKTNFIVGDVTNLEMINEKFDLSFDIGCFHCLDEKGQIKYVSEVFRLLKPGGTHLIWSMDNSPSNINLTPDIVSKIFSKGFKLKTSKANRRRIVKSHWYWLIRSVD